jgi:alginate O-acetyltransferase complex protein AlgI
MVFSSHIFLFWFLPFTLLLYYVLPRRGRHLFLTLASYFFYGWANPLFMVLMFVSTFIDYLCGLWMAGAWREIPPALEQGGVRSRGQRAALACSIVSNLALLGFFKYFNFGIDTYNGILEALGLEALRLDVWLRITLPLGISFYTFQSMSYSIDVYRGDARVIRKFTDFACYVSMFPQLVAGPIIRFQDVADQLVSRRHTLELFARGVAFVSLGLGKKVMLANTCGKIADTCFDAASVGFLDAWYGVVAYAFQIYFDFSGYSDMAIGLGLMLGFTFAKNFDSPYLSQSLTEFWRRWHLSLSTWLRDNLYIPLGGNRRGNFRTYCNLAITMLLGGLWHGASWNFVIWGALHGAALAIERARRPKTPEEAAARRNASRARQIGRTALTFLFVCLAWVFFRAADLPRALAYLGSMFGLGDAGTGASLVGGLLYRPYYLLGMAASAAVVWGAPQTWDFTRRIPFWKASWILAVFVAAVLMLTTQSFNPFIYFIF